MTEIYLPYKPRPEDPQGHMVVQANVEWLLALLNANGFVTGSNPGAIPVGGIIEWPNDTLPDLFLWCRGEHPLIADHPDLFAVIGHQYNPSGAGVDPGDGTFYLPDKQGRVGVGKGTHADVSTLANSDGLTVSARRPAHKHNATATLSITQKTLGGESPNTGGRLVENSAAPTGSLSISTTVGPQTGSEPTDKPAFQVFNYIIYAGV